MTAGEAEVSTARRWPMLVVAFGVFVAADDLMVVATMLRPMIDDFSLIVPDDLDAAAWIVNSYLVAYVAVMPIAGRLSDRFGRRAVFLAAMAVFAVGSVVVPAADSLGVLYLGRVLTALGGGALVPVALAVAADLHRGAARVRALGLLAAVETIGWVWGPLYGALLVRWATWRWQFHINVVLAVGGMAAGWLALDGTRRAARRIDWLGPAALTAGLVALCVALLSGAKIQTVTGLEQLTDRGGTDLAGPWLYPVAALALALFVWNERRCADPAVGGEPMVDQDLVADHPARAAMVVNALVSVGLVVTLINVPLFVNIVTGSGDGGVARAAVRSGWLLTAFTASMAVTSYLGGLISGSRGPRLPTVAGLTLGAAGLVTMGFTWAPETAAPAMAAQLALAGAGIGLVLAPTSAAVVDAAGEEGRGVASGLVIVARLIGFSVGLAALTAWGLHRYDRLRAGVELPPITDPDFAEAAREATVRVGTSALSETFIGGGVALLLAVALAALSLPRAKRARTSSVSGSAPTSRGRPR